MFKHSFNILFLSILFTFSFSQAPDWDCDGDGVLENYTQYQNNGSITSIVLDTNGDSIGSPGDILASFVDGEQRGAAQATIIPFGDYGGEYAFLMLSYSDEASGETMNFKFYDIESDTIYDLDETYEFVSDMTWGTVVAPEIFTIFAVSSDSYSTCEGECDDTDEDGICDDVDDCVGAYDECGVCNGDGPETGHNCDGSTVEGYIDSVCGYDDFEYLAGCGDITCMEYGVEGLVALADGYCELAGYSSAVSYDVITSGLYQNVLNSGCSWGEANAAYSCDYVGYCNEEYPGQWGATDGLPIISNLVCE
tara:strand:- start:147 stop:1070 length:924 start_codon:yes stop_codon:yes gene_type:complete